MEWVGRECLTLSCSCLASRKKNETERVRESGDLISRRLVISIVRCVFMSFVAEVFGCVKRIVNGV